MTTLGSLAFFVTGVNGSGLFVYGAGLASGVATGLVRGRVARRDWVQGHTLPPFYRFLALAEASLVVPPLGLALAGVLVASLRGRGGPCTFARR